MREIPKVILLVETARGFGRDLLSGIARYARLHGPWSFHITPGDYQQALPRLKDWGGTGIIARITSDRVADAIIAAGVPTIALGLTDEQLRADSPLSNLSDLRSDAAEVARFATEHLLERKFNHFGYVGLEERHWSNRREAAFTERLKEAGKDVHIYRQPRRVKDRVWERERKVMAEWLRSLPTPLGLFACNDDRGREVLEACRLAELNVPEDVAVIGVDNDEVFCDLADPPLSSVALNAETAGYRAAELLDGMMQGRIRKPHPVVVEALGVVTRRSTEVIAVKDADVVAALKFIRLQQGTDISVDRVAEEVAMSRRSLEKRFRETIGRTILDEIQLVRLERAKRLLLETTYPISKVAQISGFGSSGYFIQFFQSRVGKTPRRFRADLST